jgi:hypothetical protein
MLNRIDLVFGIRMKWRNSDLPAANIEHCQNSGDKLNLLAIVILLYFSTAAH